MRLHSRGLPLKRRAERARARTRLAGAVILIVTCVVVVHIVSRSSECVCCAAPGTQTYIRAHTKRKRIVGGQGSHTHTGHRRCIRTHTDLLVHVVGITARPHSTPYTTHKYAINTKVYSSLCTYSVLCRVERRRRRRPLAKTSATRQQTHTRTHELLSHFRAQMFCDPLHDALQQPDHHHRPPIDHPPTHLCARATQRDCGF